VRRYSSKLAVICYEISKQPAIFWETGYRFGFADYPDSIDSHTTRKETMLRNSILSLTMIGALAAAMFNTPESKEDLRSSDTVQTPVLTLAQAPAEVHAEAKPAQKATGDSVLEKSAKASDAVGEASHDDASHAGSDHAGSDHAGSDHAEHGDHDHADHADADHDHSDHEHSDHQHSHDHDGSAVVSEVPFDYAMPMVVEGPCCSCYTVCEARCVRVGLFKLRTRTCMVPVTVCDSCPVHTPMVAAPVVYESEMSYAEPMTETMTESSDALPPPALEEASAEEPTPAKPVESAKEAAEAVEAQTQEA
jgi:hypothetical protein